MVAVIMVMFFIVMFVPVAIREGKRRAAERARRIEAYRASPESHLLHLNK